MANFEQSETPEIMTRLATARNELDEKVRRLTRKLRHMTKRRDACDQALDTLGEGTEDLSPEVVAQVWQENKLARFLPLDPAESIPKSKKTRKALKAPSGRRGKTTGYNLYARQLREDNPGMDFKEYGREAGTGWSVLTDDEKELWKQKAVEVNANANQHTCDWVITRGKNKGDMCGRDATHLPSGLSRCRTHISSKVRGGSEGEEAGESGGEAAELAPWHDINIPVIAVGECIWILKSGGRKGLACGKPAKGGDRCKTHMGK